MRGRTWEDRETRLLLEKWGNENIQLRLMSSTRKRPIWQEIGDFLMACGNEDREGEACKIKPASTLLSRHTDNPKTNLRRRETPHQAKNLHSSTSWIKYYQITRVHNQMLSLIRQKLLRHHRVKPKVVILTSSRREAAATTEIVAAVLLKYFRSMYCQVICSCFSRVNCNFFFSASRSYNKKVKMQA